MKFCIFSEVHIRSIKPQESGTRAFDKILVCYYCTKQLRYRIGNHLKSCHSSEEEVKEAFSKADERERKHCIEKLKNMGNFNHNMKVLKDKKGELIVARRSANKLCVTDYLPCTHCYAFYRSKELFRHVKNCHFNPDPTSYPCANQAITGNSKFLLEGGLADDREMASQVDDFSKHIVDTMRRNDDVCEAVKGDKIIHRFGNILLNKLGLRRKNDISQRVRQLGKLKCAMGLSNRAQLISYLSGDGFDKILQAIYSMCGIMENAHQIKTFEIPSLALRLGHTLAKCALLKRGIALRERDAAMKSEANDFLELHEAEWTETVSSIALATLRTNKFNKNELIPLTSDVVRMKNFLEEAIPNLTKSLITEASSPNPSQLECYKIWRQLNEVTYVHSTIFNKRRASEVAELLIESFANRPKWTTDSNEEFLNTLDHVERQLLKR